MRTYELAKETGEIMPERGAVKLDLLRGAGFTEFRHFLSDLENAYLALHLLPTWRDLRRYQRRMPWFIDHPELQLYAPQLGNWWETNPTDLYPTDQLEIAVSADGRWH
jgi:hypothetical protein